MAPRRSTFLRYGKSLLGALVVLLGVGWLEACGGPSVELAPLPEDAVILAFGDSLTHGTGAERAESYPAVLERLSRRRVLNEGRPGELTGAGVERLRRVLDREPRIDLVVLCHGGNDILRRKDDGATAENLRAMIRLGRERGIPVVLVGVPDFGLPGLLDVAGVYEEVAAETGVAVEDEILPELLADNRFKSDPIHLNAAGYRRMAEAVHGLLVELGAL